MQGSRSSSDDLVSIEIRDLQKEKPRAMGELGHYRNAPPSFDFERLTRFMAYGFFMAPIQFQWFGFLSRIFPITKTHANIPALKRVAMDQLIFAPVGKDVHPLYASGILLMCLGFRSCVLLHVHDRSRRRRSSCSRPKIPGYLRANAESQLYAVARSPDPQLPCHADSVPDCELRLARPS